MTVFMSQLVTEKLLRSLNFELISLGLTCRQTRDFSSRYCSILAPSMAPRLLKWMSMYLPKRDELSLRIVLAFPKAGKKKRNQTLWKTPTMQKTFLSRFDCPLGILMETL